MEVIVKIGQLLLSLSILVILHEFGHFIFAKLFKTRVEKFYLFFDPWFSLFKFKKGDTQYGIGWLPLGGYVKISGMIDESMDKEALKKPPQPYEFRSKKTYQRLLIMLGGVMVNFITALVIYTLVLYTWGEQYLPNENVKYGIECDSLALDIGLQNGDKIISIEGEKVKDFSKIIPEIVISDAKSIEIMRNDSFIILPVPESFVTSLIKNRSKQLIISPRKPFSPYKISKFSKNSVGKKAGLKKGDEIIALNGQIFDYIDEFNLQKKSLIDDTITITVKRETSMHDYKIKLGDNGLIGIQPDIDFSKIFKLKTVYYGFWESIPAGINKGTNTISSYIKQMKLLFRPNTKAYESLGGFITIGSIFPGTWDWNAFWSLTAFLSIILAVMNILPIPALDGGHVLFLLYEIVTGRKPSDKFLEYAQIVGMVLLFSLLLFANGNDVIRLFK